MFILANDLKETFNLNFILLFVLVILLGAALTVRKYIKRKHEIENLSNNPDALENSDTLLKKKHNN